MNATTEFNRIQESVERVFRYYDDLIEQADSRKAAVDQTCLLFGIPRHKLVALLNDRDRPQAAPTPSVAVGTPTTAVSHTPVHGGYPGVVPSSLTFPEEWV